MRSAYLDDAEPEAISHAVRDVLERRGALITEHRHSRVLFSGLKPHPMSWTRAGYVGIYQPLGEREAEVRLLLRARWPWRLLLTVATLNVLVAIVTALVNPSGTTWSVLAILTGLALVVAAVIHIGTLRAVRAEERALLADFEEAFSHLGEVQVTTDEERELAQLEAELEAEIVRRRLEKARPPRAKPEKGKRFSLRPGKKAEAPADEADADARRDALLARKAELEARIREKREAAQKEETRP